MRPSSDEPQVTLARHDAGRIVVYLNPDCEGLVDSRELVRLPAVLRDLPGRESRLAGRTTLWQWRPGVPDAPPLVVRQYAHGGLLGPLKGTLFLGSGRMVGELRLAALAFRRGVPTPRPVGLRVERALGPLVRAHLVTEALPGAVNLLDFCASLKERPGACKRRRLALAAAEAVASMHDAGILHTDLNLKNLLVRNAFDAPEFFIIDFDRARLVGDVTLEQRMANLVRLDRSVWKWAASRRAIGPRDRLRMLRAYLSRRPEWRDRWAEIGRRYASRHLRHRLSRQPDRGG